MATATICKNTTITCPGAEYHGVLCMYKDGAFKKETLPIRLVVENPVTNEWYVICNCRGYPLPFIAKNDARHWAAAWQYTGAVCVGSVHSDSYGKIIHTGKDGNHD